MLNMITEDGRQQGYILPPTGVKALHDQLGQILLKHPELGAMTPPSLFTPDPARRNPSDLVEHSAAKTALAMPGEEPGLATRLRCYSVGIFASSNLSPPARAARGWTNFPVNMLIDVCPWRLQIPTGGKCSLPVLLPSIGPADRKNRTSHFAVSTIFLSFRILPYRISRVALRLSIPASLSNRSRLEFDGDRSAQ